MLSNAHIVRTARPVDLIAHLDKHNVVHSLTPASPAAQFVRALASIPDALPAERLAVELEGVHNMADEVGQTAMLALPEWRARLEEIDGAYARAHWLFLRSPEAFRQAEEIRFAEQNQNSVRLWDGFIGPRRREVSASKDSETAFKEQLRAVLGIEKISIETFRRLRQRGDMADRLVTQLTVYSEGPPVDELEFADDFLRNRSRRPVRETAIIYEADSGTIEIISQHRETRRTIAFQFAKTLLDAELSGETLPPLRLDLSPLMDEHPFPTDPADRIQNVKHTMLTLSSSDQRLTQQFMIKFKDPATLQEILYDHYAGRSPLEGDLYPWKARIEVLYEPTAGSKRGKKIFVDLTYPNKCNVRGKTDRERIILNKYLQKWGLRIGDEGHGISSA
ncbi:hypothetical protein [Bradyrhizobium sp.]|uniref:hypothetical protein n=1 Tax=Bradyrhizobium sp. TaxID=376 RepID=UPI0025C4ED42|nr:hypothetical protein [Bradyrhizobium sp.]